MKVKTQGRHCLLTFKIYFRRVFVYSPHMEFSKAEGELQTRGNLQIDLDKVLFGFNYEICNRDLEFITSFAKDYGVTTSKEFYSG